MPRMRKVLLGVGAGDSDADSARSDTKRFWQSKANEHWESQVNAPEFWQKLADPAFISDEELWALRYEMRRELIEFCRRRLLIQGQRLAHGDYIVFDSLLNPDALTIGFARRFATYKRAGLILSDVDRLLDLINRPNRPVQIIFAGTKTGRENSPPWAGEGLIIPERSLRQHWMRLFWKSGPMSTVS